MFMILSILSFIIQMLIAFVCPVLCIVVIIRLITGKIKVNYSDTKMTNQENSATESKYERHLREERERQSQLDQNFRCAHCANKGVCGTHSGTIGCGGFTPTHRY